jgi:two-component system response regulator GlrR
LQWRGAWIDPSYNRRMSGGDRAGSGGGREPETVTVAVDAAGDAEPVATVRIEVVAGPDSGTAVDACADRIVIGTHESSTVRLADRTVSRFHCEIARAGGRLVVRDLGSRNGTFIDGVEIREAFCPPAATLVLGETRVTVGTTASSIPVTTSRRDRLGQLTARSPAMRRVLSQLERVAASDATVLLLGETGTGKEIAAESLHQESPRARGPFVIVDCGAIPAELLESELFGHEKGAFTGALRTREGAFQAASGGTIFLDEIGELPKDLQPKLLRALSRRAVKPVGAESYIDVDVRVIAATNRDLRQEVNADRFRGDLYYRLAVVEVRLPQLRDRLDDLPLLVEAMLRESRASPADTSRLMSASFLDQLAHHAWPGNIRELRNVIDRALAMGPWESEEPAAPPSDSAAPSVDPTAEGPRPGDEAVPLASLRSVDLSRPFKVARDEWTAIFERAYLVALLGHHDGNIRAAARVAGIDRVHLYRLLARHGLRRDAE